MYKKDHFSKQPYDESREHRWGRLIQIVRSPAGSGEPYTLIIQFANGSFDNIQVGADTFPSTHIIDPETMNIIVEIGEGGNAKLIWNPYDIEAPAMQARTVQIKKGPNDIQPWGKKISTDAALRKIAGRDPGAPADRVSDLKAEQDEQDDLRGTLNFSTQVLSASAGPGSSVILDTEGVGGTSYVAEAGGARYQLSQGASEVVANHMKFSTHFGGSTWGGKQRAIGDQWSTRAGPTFWPNWLPDMSGLALGTGVAGKFINLLNTLEGLA